MIAAITQLKDSEDLLIRLHNTTPDERKAIVAFALRLSEGQPTLRRHSMLASEAVPNWALETTLRDIVQIRPETVEQPK